MQTIMRKRLPALLLCILLLTTTVAAAVPDSLENFRKIRSYSGQFTDVATGSTFYDNIRVLYEYGLTEGRTATRYGTADSVSVGDTLIFAGRIRSLYRTGSATAGPDSFRSSGTPLWRASLSYLISEGILDGSPAADSTQAATRAQVAHILAGLLPDSALPSVNEETLEAGYGSGRFLKDVSETTEYVEDILTLYRTGISIGSDSTGTFYPDSPITRGALSAMLTRLFQPELRCTLSWNVSADTVVPAPKCSTYASMVSAADTFDPAPAAADAMDTAIRCMISHGMYTLTLQYPSLTRSLATQMNQLAIDVAKTYCEQGYNTAHCTFSESTGIMSLSFTAGTLSAEENQAVREEALNAALAIREELWKSGTLNSSMNQYEMAKVYFQYVCEHCTYDYSAGVGSFSHLPCSFFRNGLSVCDGYTGAYNLFLKLEGISCTAMPSATHIWTVATLDGTTYHIDTTWGDGNDASIDWRYFAMSETLSRQLHGQ